MPISISHVDHFVLTVRSVADTCEFYERVLGMAVETFGANRKALRFGSQKINLHQVGQEFEPKAAHPASGAGDFCLIAACSMDELVAHLQAESVDIEIGPDTRTGACGPITSVYFRDPDENLVEVSVYQ
jgi:catechol 2,3-dioxygenase-like lactoylglutathione lyase family enzyme